MTLQLLLRSRATSPEALSVARSSVGDTWLGADNGGLINRFGITTLYHCLANIIKQSFIRRNILFSRDNLITEKRGAIKFCEVLISRFFLVHFIALILQDQLGGNSYIVLILNCFCVHERKTLEQSG